MMYTFTRRRVYPAALTPADVRVEDLAHQLALCNRFAGATRRPISVAQHCVWASRLVPRTGDLPLRALLHDGAEAYVHDVTKWVKGLECMAGYRELEDRVQAAVYAAFGVAYDGADPPELTAVDRLLVRYEMVRGLGEEMLVGPEEQRHPHYPPLTAEERLLFEGPQLQPRDRWDFWPWPRAEREFLRRFQEIRKGGE